MLTFFTTAKPFNGHSGIIQRNALRSWKLLHPDVEVILFGDEEGAAEVCAELGLRHEPFVERHESGMKYVNYIFERAQKIARHDYLCYSNCDIIFTSEFWKAFENVRARTQPFLLIGKRWDMDVAEEISFDGRDWEAELKRLAIERGQQRHFEIDYFLFRKGLFRDIPPLVNGRIYWDYWLVWKAGSSTAAVIDASRAAIAIHQNHDYGYHPDGKAGVFEDDLSRRNLELAARGKHLRTFEDATHLLTRSGLLLRTPFRRAFYYAKRWSFHIFVHKTGPIRKVLGLNRVGVHKLLGRSPRP
jgi:hypothetical protein